MEDESMEFGLDVAQHQMEWPEILRRTQLGEELGFTGVWVFDHFKPLSGDSDGPCLEAYTLLAGLGAATKRVRLGALVTGMTYRHPSVLAAEAITVDQVSSGRLELGLGAAWFQGEHQQLGLAFPSTGQRARRLEDGIEIIRRVMTEDNARYEGRYYHLDGLTYRPRPVQQPHPPIWIGAAGEQLMMPIVARQADVWHHSGNVEEMQRKTRLLDELAEKFGRDPKSIRRAGSVGLSQSWDEVRRRIDGLAAAGMTYIVVNWPAEGEDRVREFARDIAPAYT
jgi:F420-dependent oxidoreductase-like protein